MAEIGKINHLTVLRKSERGLYLEALRQGEILLPSAEVPKGCRPGDALDVFIYHDSESVLVATTRKPKALAGEFAFLKVVAVTQAGAFLDWGLPKDILAPFCEQRKKMEEGRFYLVRLYLDNKTGRIAASSKLDKFLNTEPASYTEGEEVDLIISGITDLGYSAIINHRHTGMLYKNEVFTTLAVGRSCRGFIKKIREDGKIDLGLEKPGYGKIGDLSEIVLEKIRKSGGFLNVTDKSDPGIIYKYFGTSKKNFKKAAGRLYREKKIEITDTGLKLTEDIE